MKQYVVTMVISVEEDDGIKPNKKVIKDNLEAIPKLRHQFFCDKTESTWINDVEVISVEPG